MLSLYARLEGVPSDRIGPEWPSVARFVDAAVKESANRWTSREVYDRIKAKDMQLWRMLVADEVVGVVITEIYPTAAGKTCALPIVAGDIMPHLHLLDVIKDWARQAGCVRLEGLGRPGWERALKRAGWRKIMTMVEATI